METYGGVNGLCVDSLYIFRYINEQNRTIIEQYSYENLGAFVPFRLDVTFPLLVSRTSTLEQHTHSYWLLTRAVC